MQRGASSKSTLLLHATRTKRCKRRGYTCKEVLHVQRGASGRMIDCKCLHISPNGKRIDGTCPHVSPDGISIDGIILDISPACQELSKWAISNYRNALKFTFMHSTRTSRYILCGLRWDKEDILSFSYKTPDKYEQPTQLDILAEKRTVSSL